MPRKLFALGSWNVEHFKDDPTRVARVVDFIQAQKVDVFGLYEVEGKRVFGELTQRMPGWQFHITEGSQTQEILVGVRGGISAFFTQRTEFKSGNTFLRPGALLTVTLRGRDVTILFLHTKSDSAPIGLGLRDDQFTRAFEFRKTLVEAARRRGTPAPGYLFLGDLNTMGMDYPFERRIIAEFELKKLDRDAKKAGMRRLPKNATQTWSNGPKSKLPPAELDHLVASNDVQFKRFGDAEVDVRGWPQLKTPAEQAAWIATHSDHAFLYAEVQEP
jgi:endonuclease/exonuclease/phosphatase family metal-dependent hydrolase